MENTEDMIGGGKYDMSTYIGYLKIKNNGMKIIPGDIDNKIIKNRDNILNHLNKVLSGGKQLKEKNIEKYIRALGGKYIRNDMCISGNNSHCRDGKNVSVGGARKLIEYVNDNDIIDKFRDLAPVLYTKMYGTIKKGGKDYTYKYKDELFGGDIALDELRQELEIIRKN
jgi:hypothetical protein